MAEQGRRIKRACCTALPTTFAIAALTLSSISILDCDYVRFVHPRSSSSSSASSSSGGHASAGLWSYLWWDRDGSKYACRSYPSSSVNDDDYEIMGGMEIDVWWRASRSFAVLTLLFGGFAVLVNVSMFLYTNCCKRYCCCCRRTNNYRTQQPLLKCFISSSTNQINGIYFAITCLCSSLTLLFLKGNACQHNRIFNLTNNHQCKLSTGAKCTYAAIFLWFGAAALAFVNEERGERRMRLMMLGQDASGVEEEEADEDDRSRREPLIQDAIFECEQSTTTYSEPPLLSSSSSSITRQKHDNDALEQGNGV